MGSLCSSTKGTENSAKSEEQMKTETIEIQTNDTGNTDSIEMKIDDCSQNSPHNTISKIHDHESKKMEIVGVQEQNINPLTNDIPLKIDIHNAILFHLPLLCDTMDTTEMIPYFLSREIITSREAEEIRAKDTSYSKNSSFITLIQKRGSNALRSFLESLEYTKQHHLLETIQNQCRSSTNIDNCYTEVQVLRNSLKEMYLRGFRDVNPFSLPFTFDIENNWVSLALGDDNTHYSDTTEDHAELIERAFAEVKMLIIEGNPATGKTTLMRRLAFDWAKENPKMAKYFLVIYLEFRAVCEKEFKTIADLVVGCVPKYLKYENSAAEVELLGSYINDRKFCEKHRILVLLDGYDESTLQCDQLQSYFSESTLWTELSFDIVLTTRPGYLSKHRGKEGRFLFADVLGFTSEEQKGKYISNHFSRKDKNDYAAKIAAVQKLLKSNEDLNKLAETPLFLTFICLVYNKIIDGTVSKLYLNIIWWMLDRHQIDFPDRDVPKLFGFQSKTERDKDKIIQDNYLEFPQLLLLGEMALKKLKMSIFNETDLTKSKLQPIIEQVGFLRKIEKRDESFQRITEYYFPHRTIQEFLAALSFFFSQQDNHITNGNFIQLYKKNVINYDSIMTEFEKFLWQIVSSRELEIIPTRRSDFFSRCVSICFDLTILTNITDCNSCFGNCSNVTDLRLYSSSNKLLINENESIDLSNMVQLRNLILSGNSQTRLEIRISKILNSSALAQKRNNKSIFLLPPDVKVFKLRKIDFYHPELFCETMEYFFDLLQKRSPRIEFENVSVYESPETINASYFTMKGTMKILSQNSPLKTVPEIFRDKKLDNASRYVSWAEYLDIREPNKSVGQLSFKRFKNLETLECTKMIFPATANLFISKCPKLRKLEFFHCKIDLLAWQSITKEISKSAIQALTLPMNIYSIDSLIKDNSAEFFSYLKNCQNIQELDISKYRTLDATKANVKLATIICDAIKEMNGLKKIVIYKYLKESAKKKYRRACETKGIDLVG